MPDLMLSNGINECRGIIIAMLTVKRVVHRRASSGAWREMSMPAFIDEFHRFRFTLDRIMILRRAADSVAMAEVAFYLLVARI